MQYKIHTAPVWDALKSGCECPLCEIRLLSESKLVGQYLNDAVMEPLSRVEVNKHGFCGNHLRKLYAGENKLGLALQLTTFNGELLSGLKLGKNPAAAKKEGDRILQRLSGCVICSQLTKTMEQYCQTFAQMYYYESEFPALLKKGKGFCMAHYAELLRQSAYAKGKAADYIADLFFVQDREYRRVNNEMLAFTERFDYRKSGEPLGTLKDAVPRGIEKIRGKVLR